MNKTLIKTTALHLAGYINMTWLVCLFVGLMAYLYFLMQRA